MTTMAPGDTTSGSPAGAGVEAVALLEWARDRRAAADRAEVELLEATVAWAALHDDGSVVADPYGPLNEPIEGIDVAVDLAGPGAPAISDLAVVELATVLGMSTDSGRRYVGDCLEIAHRLPRLHARLLAGDLPVWRARRVAQATRDLPPEGAAFVDSRVAGVAHRVGPVIVDRLVEEARWRYDAEEAELRAAEAAEARCAHIRRPGVAETPLGLAHLDATLDLADALDLDTTLSAIAARLAETDHARQGWTDTLDVRRSRALGILARRGPSAQGDDGSRARQVVLYLHASIDQLTGTGTGTGTGTASQIELTRCENVRGFVTEETVRRWCGGTDTRVQVTVKPVIDLHDTIAVDAHEIPDRIAERTRLTRGTCAFPWCSRPAGPASTRTDLDHITEFVHPDDGGPPGQTAPDKLAPLCRRHHRAKTHPSPSGRRWRYRREPDSAECDPATFHWTSPHGHRFTVDPHGTTATSHA